MGRGPGIHHVRGIIPDAANRAENDFYKTPRVAVERYLDADGVPPSTVWEPACGDGAISKVLEERGAVVVSTDLVDRGYGRMRRTADFLKEERAPEGVRSIATNPPFKLIDEFVYHALSLDVETVVILARLLWLEGSRRRKNLFEPLPPARVLIHSSRVNVSRNGEDYGDGGLGGMVAFAWYVWDRKSRPGAKTEIMWLP